MALCRAIRIVQVKRSIGVGPSKIEHHAHSYIGVGNIFHLLNNRVPTLSKLLSELHFQRMRALHVHLLERALRIESHAVGHQ